ncbi:MAG: threonine synthase [Euryarchaeota archaeon]|nr:threonine synthase [Euryarchaeota archaeon]
MSRVLGLVCRECKAEVPPGMVNTCTRCFGPLEVHYDWEKVQESISREKIARGPHSIWRYEDLLPVESAEKVDLGAGFKKLHRARNLGRALGLRELYVLDDSVNPTYSFKDRVTSVAVTKALEFGAEAVGCASTGNLASAVAAHAAKAGLPAYIFIPESIELGKIVQMLSYGPRIIPVHGNYDDANRLASEVADAHPTWAFVNINIRPYYTEGSKTLAFEVAEQLDWQAPDHVVVPMASGALLCAIARGFQQLEQVGLTPENHTRISGAQPSGCAPIARAVQTRGDVVPLRTYETIVHSLAIGNPADGPYARDAILHSRGGAAIPTDEEVLEAIHLLARTEGIFTEPAGGTTVAGLQHLVENGTIEPDERVVLYATGNGLKTQESLTRTIHIPASIRPTVGAFEAMVSSPPPANTPQKTRGTAW